ncbi:MAG: hypothetical protein Q8O83_03095 [bacterium]|nr:hypothetical protein [bacterium]
MKINKFILFILVLILSSIFAGWFGRLYLHIFNIDPGFSTFFVPDVIGDFIDGISSSFIFFLLLLFTAFGGEKKYRWIGILLVPVLIFELLFDLVHIYFPIAVGVIAWGLGMLLFKFLQSRQNGKA